MSSPAGIPITSVMRAVALPLCLLAVLCFDNRQALSQGGAATGAQTPPAAPQVKPEAGEPVWETVSAGGMSVSLPDKPSKQTQTVQSPAGPVEVHIISVERDVETFMVAYNEFPAAIADLLTHTDPKIVLDAGRDGVLRNTDGKLLSERDLTLNGHPAREIVGEIPSKKSAFSARIYWAKPHLYQVIYIYRQTTKPSAAGQKFLDSLRIEKAAAPAN